MRRKSVFSDRIAAALKQEELGMPLSDIIRQAGITKRTFLQWKKKYSGITEAQQCEANLQEENSNLKRIVIELVLENSMLEDELESKQNRS